MNDVNRRKKIEILVLANTHILSTAHWTLYFLLFVLTLNFSSKLSDKLLNRI